MTLDAMVPGSMGCSVLQTQFTTSMLLAISSGMWCAKKIMNKSERLGSESDIERIRSIIEAKASDGLTRVQQGGKRNKSLKTKAKKSKKTKTKKIQKTKTKNSKNKSKKNQRK